MKNILKLFSGLLILPLISGVAFAAKINISHLKSSWGNPELGRCENTSNIGNAAIGTKRTACAGSNQNSRSDTCKLGDDYGVLMLIARDVNENGAYFCPTTVYGEKHGRGGSWTLYGDSSQGQGCFWACKKGFSGEECQSTAVVGCDSTTVFREDFNLYEMVRDPEIENSIPMFFLDETKECTYQYNFWGFVWHYFNEEHDQFLAVVDWLPTGHGVWAQPVSVRANMWAKANWSSSIIAYRAGSRTLLCKNGYEPNANNTDCVAVNEETCAATQTCTAWAEVGFDQENMVREISFDCPNTSGSYGGIQFRCKTPGYAFASVADHTCTQCVENMRTGVNPSNGTCVTCEIGEIFNASAPGYCADATGFSQEQMQYGTGQNKNVDLERQCWTITDPDDYDDCVRNGVSDAKMAERQSALQRPATIIKAAIQSRVIR